MLCYRDRSYYNSDCLHPTCDRRVTEQVKYDATLWAQMSGLEGTPLSLMDFSKDCPDYTPPENDCVAPTPEDNRQQKGS